MSDFDKLPDFVRSQLDEYIKNENYDSSGSDEEEENEPVLSNRTMEEKLKNAAPYNLFFNALEEVPESMDDPNCITFTDLLCPSLGQLKCSLQLTCVVDIDWLIEQYKKRGLGEKPLTIIYGANKFKEDKVRELEENHPNITHYYKARDEWSGHNSRIGIYLYEDNSIRVVVSAANLFEFEWIAFNHLIWVSPLCPRLPSTSTEAAGESPTGFKISLFNYLKHYNLEILQPWLEHVKNADFSDVRVFLLCSIPGNRPSNNPFGHRHVEGLLTRYCDLPTRGALLWPIVAQTSALGVLRTSKDDWLKGILKTLSAHRQIRPNSRLNPALKIIFPSVRNVLGSAFGPEGALNVWYMNHRHLEQTWLHSYLHQWKADGCARSRLISHQRSYCRVSPCNKKLAWFLLTSANFTASAWGFESYNGRVFVRNHEVGVLFIPRFFDEEFFEIGQVEKNQRVFPFMYDLPLTKYEDDDYPWNDEVRDYYEKQVEHEVEHASEDSEDE